MHFLVGLVSLVGLLVRSAEGTEHMAQLSWQAGGSTEASHLTNGDYVMVIFDLVRFANSCTGELLLQCQKDRCYLYKKISDTLQGLTRIWLEGCVGWDPHPAS